MAESLAHRMLTKKMNNDRELIAREAQDIAEALTRFAQDVDKGIAIGAMNRIIPDMQQIAFRASRLAATREAVDLYEAERATEKTE
jgi:hypothetical protein